MAAFLRKDLALLLRDRPELLVLLAMPFLLISILGFSLRGIFSGDLEVLETEVALVVQDEEAQAIASVQEEIEALGLAEPQEKAFKQAAETASPETLLRSLLENETLSELIAVHEMEPAEAETALADEEIDAVITVPSGFAVTSLRNMLFGQGRIAELELLVGDLSSPQAEILRSILEEFAEAVNFEAAISRESENAVLTADVTGGIETITAREPISSFQYYTVGMAVMFVLFVGSTFAGQANLEQKQMVFDRIRLSNRPPLLYLGSKALAAALVVIAQLVLLFGLSALLFNTFGAGSLKFWAGMAIVSVVLSLAVGGLSALMVALTLRLRSDAVPAIFSGGVIAIMAFLGGSFMPMDGMPESLRAIGNWTPNGAAFSAYFSWLLEQDAAKLADPLLRILILALVFLLTALALFPRKGGAA